MATPFRSPFYSPNPPDVVGWGWSPQVSRAIRVTTTQVKFYGQPGQSPTKRWGPYYQHYESGSWYWSFKTPYNLAIRQMQLSDDQNWFYNQPDDHPVWQRTIVRNYRLLAPVAFVSKAWHYDYDSAASNWNAKPLASAVLAQLLTVGGQLHTPVWRFNYNDASGWSWSPPASRVLLVNNPFVVNLWKFNYDVGVSEWRFGPLSSKLLGQLLTAGGQPPTKSWRYDFDSSASQWQPFSVPNRNLLYVTNNPFVSLAWHYDFNTGASDWQRFPYYNSALSNATPPAPPTAGGRYDPDPLWMEWHGDEHSYKWWRQRAKEEREKLEAARRPQVVERERTVAEQAPELRPAPLLSASTLVGLESARSLDDILRLQAMLRGAEAAALRQLIILYEIERERASDEEDVEILLLS